MSLSTAGKHRITPFPWFDGQAEEAANQYVAIFPNSLHESGTSACDGGAPSTRRSLGDVCSFRSLERTGPS